MDFEDPRFEYISEYVLKTFKLKPDKWSKLVGNEEYKQIILDFFEKTDNSQLIISLSGSGSLTPCYIFPVVGKSKSLYFVKREKKDPIGKDNYKGSLLFGDLSYAPLEQLSALVDEVSYSLLISSLIMVVNFLSRIVSSVSGSHHSTCKKTYST